MKLRHLRPWGRALLLVLAVPVLALLALVLVDVFDTRIFRTFVAPRVEERLGRDVQVAELDLRWSLPLHVSVADLNIANAPWGGTPTMLSVPQATVTLEPMKLLSGPPYAHVDLRDPRIVVETSDSGAPNWTMNAPPAASRAEDPAALPVSLRAEGGEIQYQDQRDGTSMVVPLELITLQPESSASTAADTDAFTATLRARYQEVPISFEALLRATAGGVWHANVMLNVGASNLEGTVEADSSGMPLELRADLHSSVIDADQIIALMPANTSEEAAAVNIAGLKQVDVAATLAIAELRLLDMVFTDNIATASIDGAVLQVAADMHLDIALFESVLQLDGTVPGPVLHAEVTLQPSATEPLLEALGFTPLPGQVSLQLTAELPTFDGALTLAPEELLAAVRVPQADMRYTRDALELLVQARVASAGAEPVVDVKLVSATSETINARITGAPLGGLMDAAAYPVQAAIVAPAAEAHLRMDLQTAFGGGDYTVDISAMGTELPALPTLGFSPPTLPEFALKGQVRKSDASWSVTDADVELGASELIGDFSWQHAAQEPAYLQANINASVVDLPELLAFAEAQTDSAASILPDASATQANTDSVQPGILPELLNTLDMDLALTIDRLVLTEDVDATDLQMEVALHNGALQVEPLQFATDAGAMHGSVTADASQLPARVTVSLEFDDLRPSRLASAFPVLESLQKRFNGNLQLDFRERSPQSPVNETGLPVLGRFALQDSQMEVRTPQGDTQLSFSLMTTDAVEADAQALQLDIDGQLRDVPITGKLHADPLEILRDPDVPYNWMLELDAADAHVQARGTVETGSGMPALAMQFSAQQQDSLPSAQDSATLLPSWLSNSGLDVSGSMIYRDGGVFVEDLDAQIGASDFSGSLKFTTNSHGATPLDAMLRSSQLNPGELRTLLQDAREPEAVGAGSSDTVLPRSELNLEFLQMLNVDVSYTAEEVVVADTTQGPLDVSFTAQNGNLTLDPIYLELANGGELRVQSDLRATQSALQGSVQATARRVDLGTLFAGTSLVKDGAGLLGGQAKFWLRGDSLAAMLGSLDGGLMLMVSSALVEPVLVEGAGLDIGEALLAASGVGDAMPVNCAYASAYARGGILTMEHVVIDTPDSTFYLAGQVDLQQETLDLALHNETKDSAIIASGSPIALRGRFSMPEVVLLTDELATDVVLGAALTVLASPAAALLTFVDAGDAAQVAPVCRGWVEELREVL